MIATSPRLQLHNDDEQLNLVTNEEDIIALIKQKETQRWNYGLFVIFIAIATWMVGTQLINSVIKSGAYSGQPVFIGYMSGSGFIIYLLPETWHYIKYNVFLKDIPYGPNLEEESQDQDVDEKQESLTFKEMVVLAIQIAFIYFLNNSLVALSLEFTSSSQQVLLGTSTSFFTLMLGTLCKVEVITATKFGVLLLAISGVALVTLNDAQVDHEILKNPVLGDIFALSGSFFYACYLVLIKFKIGETTMKVNERLLFGLVGLATIVLIWPLVVVSNYVPLFSPFTRPPDFTVWIIVILNGVLGAISDYCCVIAMLLTSPLVVTLSLTSAIPIGMICDSLFYGIDHSGLVYYTGIAFIISSVVLSNVTDSTIEHAIEEALEDAILKDENLSPLLTPLLSPQFNKGIGGSAIDQEFGFEHNRYNDTGFHSDHRAHQIVVSGGYNHKYIIKGLRRD